MSDIESKAKVKYPLELKKKALLELAERGSSEAVARHYNVSEQTVYNWKSDVKRKSKRFEKKSFETSRHFQELLELKRENAKLKERLIQVEVIEF
ncbi:MAG: transposase [Bdellovibrionales bacterium]|nr:transposase [Bdellovibrionales bacterium]